LLGQRHTTMEATEAATEVTEEDMAAMVMEHTEESVKQKQILLLLLMPMLMLM